MLLTLVLIAVGTLIASLAVRFWYWANAAEYDGFAPEVGLGLALLVTLTFAVAALVTGWVHALVVAILPWTLAILLRPRLERDWLDRYERWLQTDTEEACDDTKSTF